MWRRLWGGPRSGQEPAREWRPSADDFTPEAVRRALLVDTLQHPAVVLPASVAVVAGMWASVFGGQVSFLTLLAGVFAAASSWIYQFVVRGDALAERHLKGLRELRARAD